jgi:hopanoid biosynthesis associated RND transporter like protein HpnN
VRAILSDKLQHALNIWIGLICKRAIATLVLAGITSVLLFYYTISNISINTDTSDMLSPDLPFRQNSIAVSKSFPQFSDNIVIVIDGFTADLVNDAADLFSIQLKKDPSSFGEVFDPVSMEFFIKNGLLYFTLPKLEELSDRLIAAQPFISTLWANPSLSGLFNLLSLFLKEGSNKIELMRLAKPMFDNITDIIIAQNNKTPKRLSWHTLISGQSILSSEIPTTRIIIIQPNTNFGSLEPGKNVINKLRKIGQNIKLAEKYKTRLRLTGSVPLAQEELESVVDGLGVAGVLSLALVTALLFWGLKSARLVLAIILTLCCGLVWTAGLATLTIGTLNLISVAFAVLFIGLSVDFGIHFALCYLRFFEDKGENIIFLQKSVQKVGGALSLTTIAAAIGFYSFLPTDYLGLAELGFIAGSGMFIALFTNLSILPALICLMPPQKLHSKHTKSHKVLLLFKNYKQQILAITVMLSIACVYLAPKVFFDFDPLNLKDFKTESVSTLLDLSKTDNSSPYSITVLAKDLKTADLIAKRAKKLPMVKTASTLSDLIPLEQDKKLAIVDNLAFILGPVLSQPPSTERSDKNQQLSSILNLQNRIREFDKKYPDPSLTETLHKFDQTLNKLLKTDKLDQVLVNLEQRLLGSLPSQLLKLKNSLNAQKITLKNIPKSLFLRQVSSNGLAKVDIFPNGDMRDKKKLSAFVKAVRGIAPNATGTPVVVLEAGKTVINSFVKAIIITLTLIIILVMSLTNSFRELVLILTPLILASLFTISASVLLNLPFNFANVIVLPLLFGLGIASSIHLVLADRENDEDVMRTSTPRAIVFSALTTIGSFGSIALSSHPGTSSMGLLLTIALICSLICTLVILPALLSAWPKAILK